MRILTRMALSLRQQVLQMVGKDVEINTDEVTTDISLYYAFLQNWLSISIITGVNVLLYSSAT